MAHALQMSKSDFCLGQTEFQSRQNFTVEGKPPPAVLLSSVSRLMEEFNIQGPLVFHFTEHEGPKKVWSLQLSKIKHVYFAKNAVDLLLGLELEKISQEVCRPEWTGTKTFTVVYTNTVLEQFLRHTASRENLLTTLKRKTGWSFRSVPGDKYYENEQEFRTEELVTIVKQLVDVPNEVLKLMKIKKLTRYRIGAPLPIPTAQAIYYVQEQNIMIGDGAVMDDALDIYGEGTILHEMGHAYWYGSSEFMRKEFTAISWESGKRRTEGSEGFISSYSMNTPEEDFAEHFAAFVHNSELLKRKAMKKFDFFQKNIFSDTTYFSTVATNAKVFVKSPVPDTKPPRLLDIFAKSYKAKATIDPINPKVAEINVVVTGALDDISGVAQTLYTYEHEKNSKFRVFLDLIPEHQEDGTTILRASVKTDPNKLAPGLYRPSTLNLEDNAGNSEFYRSQDLPSLELPGNLSLNALDKIAIDFSKIKMGPAPIINGYQGVITTFPVPFRDDIESIHLDWEVVSVEGKTTHVCNFERKERNDEVPCQTKNVPGQPIIIQSYFFKQYPKSVVKLASVLIRYKGSESATKDDHSYVIPVNTPNAEFFMNYQNSTFDLIDLSVNDMKLSTDTRPNGKGGDQNIDILIPLINHKAGEFRIGTTMRSPTGKQIYNITSESLKKEYTLTTIGGVEYVKFSVELKKNPEEGEYILESFEIKTSYDRPLNPILPLDLNGISVIKIKLLERGIRRTFTISDDKIINLN